MSDSERAESGEAPTVSPAELADRLRRNKRFTVLDVRDRDEFERWHVEGPTVESRQLPHVKFIQASVTGGVEELVGDLSEPIVTVCARGEASADVAAQLVDAGIEAANLAGGMNAWGRHYETIEIESETGPDGELPATVLQYDRVASGCLSYLVVAGGEAAVIDPLRAFADRYVADARERGAQLRYAIDTHVHADHVSGVRAVAEAADAEVVLPEGATERGLAFDPRLVADGESLPLGETALLARALPGHTSEMTGFALGAEEDGPEAPLWFTGDTVFPNAVARPDLEAEATDPESSSDDTTDASGRRTDDVRTYARNLHRTITERLERLPERTVLAPGHRQELREGPSVLTVSDLERFDVLDLDPEAFVDRIVGRMGPQPANFREIVDVNLGRESLAGEDELALELGPNNCAVS